MCKLSRNKIIENDDAQIGMQAKSISGPLESTSTLHIDYINSNNIGCISCLSKINSTRKGTFSDEILTKEGKSENGPIYRVTVSFSTVQVRHYDVTLGDHPDCTYGPPISLDWTYDESIPAELNTYESDRLILGRNRIAPTRISCAVRKNLMSWCCGFTKRDILKAEKAAKAIRRQRRITRYCFPFRRLEEALELARR
mmetsp:Transcript_52326/g.61090  ORF Transcript_52326/g.61090 Transcript_52326/m.61090 type:complete len:198 (+) Transcript_52326:71-664(+)